MLYNEELKQRYIDYKENVVTVARGYLKRLFTTCEPYESRKNKDVCNFTATEIIELYQMMNRQSKGTLSVINSTLSQYTNWCMMQNIVLDNQNHFLEITPDRYADCVNALYVQKSVLTRDEVLEITNKFDNYCDKFIALAFFEGLCGKDFKEIWAAHYVDIDETNQTINLVTGRTIEISKQLIDYAYEASQSMMYHSLGETNRSYAFLESDDTIVKNYMNCKEDVSDHQRGRRIYTKLQRLLSSIDLGYLKPQALIDSGKIDYVNRRSKELGISGEQYVMTPELLANVEKQYGIRIPRSIFLSRFGQFLNR